MALVANARMYSVAPAAAAAWKELFGWLASASGVDLVAIDHGFPLPLADLWARDDLAAGFMCGFPFVRSDVPLVPVAAPVPNRGPRAGQPAYASHLIVAVSSALWTIEDTFGGRVGYTVEDSHSGYNALRHHLLPYRAAKGRALYRESIGELFTPRRVVDALLAGTIDVGPLDSYAYELLAHHEPDLVARIRIVATTESAPIPFLVASPEVAPELVASLRAALLRFADVPDGADLRGRLCLSGFASVDRSDYAMISHWDAEARTAGYGAPF